MSWYESFKILTGQVPETEAESWNAEQESLNFPEHTKSHFWFISWLSHDAYKLSFICAFKGMKTGNNKLPLLVTLPEIMTSTENVLYDDFSVLDPCTSVYFLTSRMQNRICIALITPIYLRTP